MNSRISAIVAIVATSLICGDAKSEFGQTQPTRVGGTNHISFDEGRQTFYFHLNDDTLYSYWLGDEPVFYRTGGNLHGLKAKAGSTGQWFYPSNVGGICLTYPQWEILPVDENLSYQLIGYLWWTDTVSTTWQLTHPYFPDSWFTFTLAFHIEGRTLVIRAQKVESSGFEAKAFNLDRSEDAMNARIVRVPQLTLFNLLYSNSSGQGVPDGVFTSVFFDWERTNASGLWSFPGADFGSPPSTTSKWFSHVAVYDQRTDYSRNPLNETIYLTVSQNLDDVLPNLPGDPAPQKNAAWNKLVFSFFPNYHQVLFSASAWFDIFRNLKNNGVDSLAIILKQYQRRGFDNGFPAVLPPNNFDDGNMDYYTNCYQISSSSTGYLMLDRLMRQVRDTLHYDIALHENYFDYHSNGSSADSGFSYNYSAGDRTLLPNGTPAIGVVNQSCSVVEGYLLKPSKYNVYADYWSTQIHNRITPHPTWSYLDVHTAKHPSNQVDFQSGEGAGRVSYVISKIRELPGSLRKHGGPVQGEGGMHMLYVGTFDDFEARLNSADPVPGQALPVLVDFDLRKMHGKSALHGVGVAGAYWKYNGSGVDAVDQEEFYESLATTLAYGHGGYWDIPDFPVITYLGELHDHVLPMQQSYGPATVNSIQYYDSANSAPYSASEYIRTFIAWDDTSSSSFMGRLKVSYSNGAVVVVNRTKFNWQNAPLASLPGGGWYTFRTGSEPAFGYSRPSGSTLPSNGWACYKPMDPYFEKPSVHSSSSFEFRLDPNYPNPFNPATTFSFSVGRETDVQVTILDILGRQVTTVLDNPMKPGEHKVQWNASDVASGVYFVRIRAGEFAATRKLLLLK